MNKLRKPGLSLWSFKIEKEKILKIVIFLCFLIYILEGIFFIIFGNIWTDENWYFAKSYLVSKGKLPYRDFFDHHMPLSSLVYAIPLVLFGPNLYFGRITSFLFSFLAVFLGCLIAKRLCNKIAVLLVILLNMTNLFVFYYNTTMSAHPLEVFFIIFSVYLLISGLKRPFNYILSVILMALANSVKYLTMPALWILLAYITIKERKNLKTVIYVYIAAVSTLCVINLPFLLIEKDRFIFGIIWGLKREHRSMYELPMVKLIDNLLTFIPVIQNYLFIYLFLPLIGVYAWAKNVKKHGILQFISKYNIYVLIALVIFCYEFLVIIRSLPGYHYPQYRLPYFILAVVLVSIGIAKIFANIRETVARTLFISVIILLIIYTPLLQSEPWEMVNLGFDRTDIACVNRVSDSIKKLTNKNDKVFTFSPIFAAQADREPLTGMESEMVAYYPSWPEEKCKRFGLLNGQILNDYLKKKETTILVLTDDRFFKPFGRAELIKKDLPMLIKTINKNYYLKEKLIFDRIFRGNVYIYLRKE